MWQSIRGKILQTSKAAGVEIIFTQDGALLVHAVCLGLKKNKIIIEKQYSGDLKIIEQIPKSCPVYVSFNGKGVFSKKVSLSSDQNTATHLLPESNPNDFYFTQQDYSQFSVIAIARKPLIDELIKRMIERGSKVINACTGFQPVNLVLPYITTTNDSIRSSTYLFSIQNKEISAFETTMPQDQSNNNEFIFSEQYVPGTRAIALGAAVAMLTDDIKQLPVLTNEQIHFQRKDFGNYLLFKFWGWTLLAGMLVILLINFIFFSHYAKKNNEQESLQISTRGNADFEQKLEHTIKRKELFFEHAGWMIQNKTSYYADRIASLLPVDILLTSLQFNPLQKSKGSFRQVAFKTNTIELSGDCSNPAYLNQFTNNLKNIAGIRKITVLAYQYNKEKNTGSFALEIIIE